MVNVQSGLFAFLEYGCETMFNIYGMTILLFWKKSFESMVRHNTDELCIRTESSGSSREEVLNDVLLFLTTEKPSL